MNLFFNITVKIVCGVKQKKYPINGSKSRI